MKDSMADYPECEKLLAVTDRSQQIGEFLEWLPTQGIHRMRLAACSHCEGVDSDECWLCDGTGTMKETWVPDGRTIEQLLADFFGIDMAKVDVERRAMLAALRAANDWSASEA